MTTIICNTDFWSIFTLFFFIGDSGCPAVLGMEREGTLHQTMSQRGVWSHSITLDQKTSGEIQQNTTWYMEGNTDSDKVHDEELP